MGVVERRSTETTAVSDPLVFKAMDWEWQQRQRTEYAERLILESAVGKPKHG